MSTKDFYIGENDFRILLPDVDFYKAENEEDYNSRKIQGIMSTDNVDRQGETVIAKGLDFNDFLHSGFFNDNHSQETSAIVGYPEAVQYHKDLVQLNPKLKGVEGWSCRGYVLKGTKRAEGIWELAQALGNVPSKKLGFSIEGKVIRRKDKTIEKANIRNVAITNCPVNVDCTWALLAKSFYSEEMAMKSLTAGYAVSPGAQSGGAALRVESLDSDVKKLSEDKKKKRNDALKRALEFDDMSKAMDFVLETRPDFDEEAAAIFIKHLYKKGGKL